MLVIDSTERQPGPVAQGSARLEEISFRRYPGWIDLTKLLVFSVLENVGYRQLLALFKVRAFWDVIRRKRGWGRMEREGFREAPATRA